MHMAGRRLKPIAFLGDALDLIRAFPEGARKEAGVQLHKVQQGFPPSDWKPVRSVGLGVAEIRIHDAAGAFRVIYIATTMQFTSCTRSRRRPSGPRNAIWTLR
jgi:phage-related protein